MAVSTPRPGLAVSVELILTPTDEGGRHRSIGAADGEDASAVTEYPPMGYRPNWGLPGMTAPEQTGAPVLCFGHYPVVPGDTVGAVLITVFPDEVPRWSLLRTGDVLVMYEGARVCGHATVDWIVPVEVPVAEADRTRLTHFLRAERQEE